MKDPIGSFDIIKENFIRYVKTAFGTRFDGFEVERHNMLNRDRVLYREPWIEPLPDYLASGKRIDQLTRADLSDALSATELETFKQLVKTGLFPSNGVLHQHQLEMLSEAMAGKNCVITSGTGSGKTEAFLLPLFAQLAKESATWNPANPKSATVNNWWNDCSPKEIVDTKNSFVLRAPVRHRNHDTRTAGVRGLIIYPMNALVEDQMSRMRKALDSDDTRLWLNERGDGNAFYFGRYNGDTPVAGDLKKIKEDGSQELNSGKLKELKDRLRQIEKDANSVKQYIVSEGISREDAKELQSFFQRLDGSEMRCRFDMQISPPDILITNYSMLSIMLMRQVDSGIFDKTRYWLSCEDLPEGQKASGRKDRIFHLIIDELHLYRGTQGTEVAYLLKLVLNRIGLSPNHPQLRILASSASLESGDNRSKKFLEDFFGVDDVAKPFKIISGKTKPIAQPAFPNKKLPTTPFESVTGAYEETNADIKNEIFIKACRDSALALSSHFGVQIDVGGGVEQLLKMLLNPALEVRERLYNACEEEGNYRAVCSIQSSSETTESRCFAESIFGSSTDKYKLRRALRGILIARGLFDEPSYSKIENLQGGGRLPKFRFHFFFRNIEGVWASTKPDDLSPDSSYADGKRTCGTIYPMTRIRSEKGYRVLELLYCDNCGTTFFGGSRLAGANNSLELLAVSPNIEGVPEKTPAKLVERRSYQEFAVFWPMGSQDFVPHDAPRGYWRQPTLSGINQSVYEARWIPASLNVYSGDVDFGHSRAQNETIKWIKGYLFQILNADDVEIVSARTTDSETHRALPSVCPACGINHQRRTNSSKKSKLSSVRGFRTGFAKTTQMFAKELMYQISESESKRKLVVFSDSREDAAQVANGIERNHFTDLLREILVTELHSGVLIRSEILDAFDSRDEARKVELRRANREGFDEIEVLHERSIYGGNNQQKLREKLDSIAALAQYRSRTVSVRTLIDKTNSLDLAPLIRRLVQLGINPGGNDLRIQRQQRNTQSVPWYDLIDFPNLRWLPGANPGYIADIKGGTYSNLSSILFGSLFYSFESSALGYLTVRPGIQDVVNRGADIGVGESEFYQILNSTIRTLGDAYRHNRLSDPDAYPFEFPITEPAKFPSRTKKYLVAVASRMHIDEDRLMKSIYDVLTQQRLLTPDRGIIVDELFLRIAEGRDGVWMNSLGNRPHLHASAGICTQSMSPLELQADKPCINVWRSNYLSYNAIIQKRQPIRLHCEELTGQTDDQFERQRHFRNIILGQEGNRRVKTIDLLSVTTTLEVGVDIGALQAVMLANMPPQRFNYQQRVGRAGRRENAYSIILTFCRGRSHDEHYFSNPKKITGDAPPIPFLTMAQPRIIRRLLAKEILRKAYLTIPIEFDVNKSSPNVHGAFGSARSWDKYKIELEKWIMEHRQDVESVVSFLLPVDLRSSANVFVSWVLDLSTTEGLIGKVNSIIQNEEIATDDIAEKLAEGGILPMFGMPTTVKNMYHGLSQNLEPLSVDRPQAMAIYEFAPGAQKTKDKAIHTVIGFTSDLIKKNVRGRDIVANTGGPHESPFSLNRWMVLCKSCSYFETYSDSRKKELDGTGYFSNCPNCGTSNPKRYYSPRMIKTPKAYRTNLSMGSDLRDDSELMLSRPPIFAEKLEDPSSPDLKRVLGNTRLVLSDKDVTWRVNNNSDKYFLGRLYETKHHLRQGGTFTFGNQWLLNDLAAPVADDSISMSVTQQAGSGDEEIALVANKKTEILRLAPSSLSVELDLNMFPGDVDSANTRAQSVGVRSAFFSAAFLLQRVLADRLDVDPNEIEIADIVFKRLDDGTERKVAEIVLIDELPNGSGFVRYLYEHFDSLLDDLLNPSDKMSYLGKIHSELHQSQCKDACYECLKVFRNMNYHSLLDWRLGLALLRIMKNADYKCGANGEFTPFVEIRDWIGFASELRDVFAYSFDYTDRSTFGGLPTIKWGSRMQNLILVVHPFWDLRSMKTDSWLTEAKLEIDDYVKSLSGTLSIVDSFNLHRRPGWCYEKLINRQ